MSRKSLLSSGGGFTHTHAEHCLDAVENAGIVGLQTRVDRWAEPFLAEYVTATAAGAQWDQKEGTE